MALGDPYASPGLSDEEYYAQLERMNNALSAPVPNLAAPIAPQDEFAQPTLPPPPPPQGDLQFQVVDPTPEQLAAFDKSEAEDAAREDAAWAAAHPEQAPALPTPPSPVDAISDASGSGLPPGPGQTTGAPEMPDEYRTPQELGEKQANTKTQEQLFAEQTARQDEAAQKYREGQLAALQRDADWQQQNQKILADATAQANAKSADIQAQAARVAETPIDQQRFANKSMPQAVAGFLGAIVGGFSAPNTGGRNLGMDGLQKSIDQDIETQKYDIENKRAGFAAQQTMVAQEYARTGDLYHAAETARLAAYQGVIQKLEIEAQNYDARGTTANRIASGIQQMRAAQAQQIQKQQSEMLKQQLDLYKAVTERMAPLETARHNQVEESIALGKLGGGAGLANENQLVAGLSPKDRERAVFSPDGKTYRLAVDHETAVKQRDEISSGNAAIHAADSVIADLSSDVGLMAKIKARAGLNPRELAVLKSKLSLLKPMIAKVAAGTGRIPLAELHAVDAATDDPSGFTSETLAQIRAMRDATVNDLADKFDPEYPGFIAKGSFGHAPEIQEPPNINTIMAPLLSAPAIGNKGAGRIDVANVDATLKQAAQEYNSNPGLGGGKEYASQLDDAKAAQEKAIASIEADSAKLSKKAKRTPDDNARLHQNALAIADRQQAIRAIEDAKEQSIVVDVRQAKAKQDDLAHKLIHPSEPR